MKRVSFAVMSAIILVLAFPPFNIGFLAWGALMPFMYALDGAGRRKGFFLGLVFGFFFFLGTVYWVVNSMSNYGGIPLSTSILLMLLLVATLGIYTGLFGLFSTMAFRYERPAIRMILIPSLWVTVEYLRGYITYFGFPWILIGYSQMPYLPVIQVSDITGVWGVSFLVLMVNAAGYELIRAIHGKKGKLPFKEAMIAAVALVVVVAYGVVRIKEVDLDEKKWKDLRVGIAQGSIDQSLKWNPSFERDTIRIYGDLSDKESGEGARFIVWPETAVPFYLGEDQDRGATVRDIAKKADIYILTGSPSYNYNAESGAVSYFNSAYLLDPTGDITGRYDKMRLVPYGEYVPLKRFFPFIKKLTVGVGEFSSGRDPEPMRFNGGKVGALICFESIFPDIAGDEVRAGATVLANITNDAWFGRTSAPYQHFEMAAMRAVENKVFLLRAANTGISAVVDPVGRVREKTALFVRAGIVDNIKLRQGPITFYSKYGDVFAYCCIIVSGMLIPGTLRRR